MVPVINVSDIVVIDSSITPDEVEVGDIMAFNVDITGDGRDDVVVHYIDGIRPFGDELIYKTIYFSITQIKKVYKRYIISN